MRFAVHFMHVIKQVIKHVIIERSLYVPSVVVQLVLFMEMHRNVIDDSAHVAGRVGVVRAYSPQCATVCDACS